MIVSSTPRNLPAKGQAEPESWPGNRHATCIGVDVGGTFTDAVAFDTADGSLRWAKAPSTPNAPAVGVLDAVSALSRDLDTVERFVHGITIGTNAIIERKGPMSGW